VFVVRRILITLAMVVVLLGGLSESRGNIIGFSGMSNQPQLFGLDAAAGYYQRAVEIQETVPEFVSQSLPAPDQPRELPTKKGDWHWVLACRGLGSGNNSHLTGGGSSSPAVLGSRFKLFLAQPLLSWVRCGEKLLLPDPPLENLLKVPIC
jgi:hypothetical protein